MSDGATHLRAARQAFDAAEALALKNRWAAAHLFDEAAKTALLGLMEARDLDLPAVISVGSLVWKLEQAGVLPMGRGGQVALVADRDLRAQLDPRPRDGQTPHERISITNLRIIHDDARRILDTCAQVLDVHPDDIPSPNGWPA